MTITNLEGKQLTKIRPEDAANVYYEKNISRQADRYNEQEWHMRNLKLIKEEERKKQKNLHEFIANKTISGHHSYNVDDKSEMMKVQL